MTTSHPDTEPQRKALAIAAALGMVATAVLAGTGTVMIGDAVVHGSPLQFEAIGASFLVAGAVGFWKFTVSWLARRRSPSA